MKNNFSLSGFLLLIAGIFFSFFPNAIAENNLETILALLFITLSISLILFTLHKMDAVQITAAVVIFYSGLILFTTDQYELFTGTEVIFPLLLILIGSVTTLLFIRNSAEKIFLWITVLFFGFAGYLLLYPKSALTGYLGNGLYLFIFDYWQTLLIIFGAFLLVRKRIIIK